MFFTHPKHRLCTFPLSLLFFSSAAVQTQLQRSVWPSGGRRHGRRRWRHRRCRLEGCILKQRGEHVTVRHGPPGQGSRTPNQSVVSALLAKEKQYCFLMRFSFDNNAHKKHQNQHKHNPTNTMHITSALHTRA